MKTPLPALLFALGAPLLLSAPAPVAPANPHGIAARIARATSLPAADSRAAEAPPAAPAPAKPPPAKPATPPKRPAPARPPYLFM